MVEMMAMMAKINGNDDNNGNNADTGNNSFDDNNEAKWRQ